MSKPEQSGVLNHTLTQAPLKSPGFSSFLVKRWGFPVAIVALAAISLMPQPAGLSQAGQYMLGILAFAIVIWMTEALDYAASAVILVALMTFMLGMTPNPAHPGHRLGTEAALTAALSGFTNSAVSLIAASLIIAVGMATTGLDKRIAVKVISVVGTSPRRLLVGIIIVMGILAFFVPTAAARVACLVPIMLGMTSGLGIDKKHPVTAMLMMSTVFLSLIWAMGIATGAAQNVYVNAMMEQKLHASVSWIDWLIAGAPFSIAVSVALYFVLPKMMMPDGTSTDESGRTLPKPKDPLSKPKDLVRELGPITHQEIKLLVVFIILVGLWATQGIFHPFDSSSVAVACAAVMFLPKVGLLDWKQVQSKLPWGILVQLGVGVGLGTVLLKTGTAGWLATFVVSKLDIQHMSGFEILAVLWLFMIVVHLGFSSGAAMATTMIPVMISVFEQAQFPVQKIVGMTMLLTFTTSFGWILPINGPQNMLAFGTETFTAREFIRVGLAMTVAAYLLLLLFAATWWHWLGYV
jgi:sodium-dependent dicarboxylate transporter 2/3/5